MGDDNYKSLQVTTNHCRPIVIVHTSVYTYCLTKISTCREKKVKIIMYNISLATRQKPRIDLGKLHYVQETQKTVSKQTVD